MEKIASFTINHLKLSRGIFVSRRDLVGGEVVTTFDIRMKEPNREPALGQGAIHTIEHLAATYLRNNPEWRDRIVYWGPMGCLTGNYLLLRGDYSSADILPQPATRVKCPAPPPPTAATGCCTTCPWPATRPASILRRCWSIQERRIWSILRLE